MTAEEIRTRELLASWMLTNGYATGHGDTVEDLIKELDWQHKERITESEKRELAELREAISPGRIGKHSYYLGVAKRMRARELQILPLRAEADVRDIAEEG